MLPNATQVAQLLDTDDNISCSVCDSPKNRCDGCATLLEQRRKMNAVVERLYQLRNKRQLDKEKAQGRGTGKKKPLNWKGLEASCSKAKESKPSMGWNSWYKELLRKAEPSQPEQDAILLIQAFNDSLLGWMLLAYSEVDEWLERPSKYREILLYIMKTSEVAKLGTNRLDMPVQAPHEVAPTTSTTLALQLQQIPHRDTVIATEKIGSPSRAVEQHMEGVQEVYGHSSSTLPTRPNDMMQPSDSPAACEGRANERDDVDAHTQLASESIQRNVKRPNDGDSPKRKRMRLEFGQSDPHGVNETMLAEHAISTSISVPNQEPCIRTSPEQCAGVETPAPTGWHFTIHSLISVPPASTIDVSPNFGYPGQTGSAEPMRCDGSTLDGHTSTHRYDVCHVREDNSMQTPGMLDDPSPWSDPIYALGKLEPRLCDLEFLSEERLIDTEDSIVTYRWGGLEAINCIGENAPSVDGAKWCYLNMALCMLPFETLRETIKQSGMWKREKLEVSAKTSCLMIRVGRRVKDRYCELDCVVPTAMVLQVRGIHRPVYHSR